MKALYNSHVEPVAPWDDDDLFTLSGEFVGCYERSAEIFTTCDGDYRGEMFKGNYLGRHRRSPHRDASFPIPDLVERISHYGRLSPTTEVTLSKGYQGVDLQS